MLILAGLLLGAACTDQAPVQPVPPTTPPPTAPPTAPGTTVPAGTTGTEAPPTTMAAPGPEWNADGAISAGEYDGEVTLANGQMIVYWKNDGTMLYMGLWGRVTGWVAIGFEPTTAMKDADMILGSVSSGQVTVLDQYATGTFGPHPSDTELGGTYDIIGAGGSESGGVTVIEFSRKLNTGDRFDKVLTPGSTVRFIWSMADTDVPTAQHNIARGSGQLVL
ncbi:MAG: hypothetical protein GKC06_01380 [Methanomicrobiales archaeon]|nr:hypothetical protein [Methanomicrobiales archaeon]